MGTKNNPGPWDCYAKLEPDEPFYLLMGRSLIAPLLVRTELTTRLWQVKNGIMRPDTQAERDQIAAGFACLTEMEIWGRDYRNRKEHAAIVFDERGVPTTGPHRFDPKAGS